MKLVKKTIIDHPTETYNLHIENDHNYIANNVVVSNCHMAKADVLKKLLTQNLCNTPIRWGLTGTVPKEEINFQNIKVSLGEITSKEYINTVYKKYNLKSNENINININTIKPHKNTQNHTYVSQK